MVELGIISDEVDRDFERSCALIKDWGLAKVELRTLWDKNILELSEHELTEARAILEEYGLSVAAIASPIFKSPLEGTSKVKADFALAGSESFTDQLRLLERASDLCKRFETQKIRIFSFLREPWTEDLVQTIAAKLMQAAEVASEQEVLLVVENEPICNVRYGRELGELFEAITAQAPALEYLAILWDPGNALYAGERPYPDGYEALPAGKVAHVHLKDVAFKNDKPYCVPLGWGEMDTVGQLRQLKNDGYEGDLILEPHYRPAGVSAEEAAHSCVKAAQSILLEAWR